MDIATSEMQRLRAEIKIAKNIKKDCRLLSRARVITGAEALEAMHKAEEKKKVTGKRTQNVPTTAPQAPRPPSTSRRTRPAIHVASFPRVYALTTLLYSDNHLHSPNPPGMQCESNQKASLILLARIMIALMAIKVRVRRIATLGLPLQGSTQFLNGFIK
ncbi:hypothetical protein B9Z19DRAFT_1060921 [Tuber borchii]|uniref:Uncharacterized protein n=1 Tax=Tuber borchii TaxID=42251 RepID=A0A2T7A703_TUBBO|nr:hypothetical protein B9Z19DRAFT_1060921 [Tuber borchii]